MLRKEEDYNDASLALAGEAFSRFYLINIVFVHIIVIGLRLLRKGEKIWQFLQVQQ